MYNKRKIIHVDMDAFFASIEQKDNPSLKGKPLIVGGNPQSRGVVATCSYEARKFGIHSAMPCSKAASLCPKAIFIRPRIERYKTVSAQIMAILRQYTQLVEPLSLDEAFLDVTTNSRLHTSATVLAEEIRKQIYKELQLTASAGVSFNKFLAKVASDINKPNGIITITPEKSPNFIASLPIRKFFGVGKITEKKMLNLGIKTGHDLRQWEAEKLKFHFGKMGLFLYDIVRGIDHRLVEPERIRKSIGSEITLPYDTNDIVEIHNILDNLAKKIATSIREKEIFCSTLTVKIRYHDFTTITRSLTSKTPIYTHYDIVSLLPRLLISTKIGTRKVRLLGLCVSKFRWDNKIPQQLLLPFMTENS